MFVRAHSVKLEQWSADGGFPRVLSSPDPKELTRMLAISDSAAEAIRGLVAGPEVPDSAGLRIATHPTAESSFEASVAATPAEDDEVVEEQGAQVFLEPGAAALLQDKRLEAQIEGGQVTFAISEQAA